MISRTRAAIYATGIMLLLGGFAWAMLNRPVVVACIVVVVVAGFLWRAVYEILRDGGL